MRKFFTQRHFVPLLLMCLFAIGVQAEPLKFYVSQKRGNDTRNGTSWNAAFKTLDAALKAVESNSNLDAIIYMAEGKYNVDNKPVGGKSYYTLLRENQSLRIYGGFPTPGSQTLPKDTCSNNPKRYVTELVANSKIKSSVFRTNNSNQTLTLQGITFNSTNFVGSNYDGSLITLDNDLRHDVTFAMEDCRVNYYRSAGAGAIFVYGRITSPKIKLHRVEVMRGESGGAIGGGFLVANVVSWKKNSQIDLSYITFHDIQHVGSTQEGALIGWTNAGTWDENPDAYVKIDHMQVNRAEGGTATGQHGTFFLEGFKNISVTNSNFHNSKAGNGGLFRISSFVNFRSENNSYYSNFGGDIGGAYYFYDGAQASAQIDKTNPEKKRSIVFKNDKFYGNISGKTLAKGKGGALAITAGAADIPCDVTIENCNFKKNETLAMEGGAAWIGVAGEVNIKNSIFCGNTANSKGGSGTGAGGAMRIAGTSKKVTIEGCYFSENYTRKGGGAIELESGGEYFVKNCVFDHNYSYDSGSAAMPSGGALSVASGIIHAENCKFFSNEGGYFGAVGLLNNHVKGESTFDRCEFTNNKAKQNGAAIGVRDPAFTVLVTNSIFTNNEAGNDGGVFYVNTLGKFILKNNTFIGNKAASKGGVAWISADSYVKSYNNRYYNNQAMQGGVFRYQDDSGGIASRDGLWSYGDVYYGNQATTDGKGDNGKGGALFIYIDQGKSVVLKDATFVGNKAYKTENNGYGGGGAIYYTTRTALTALSKNRHIIDSLYNCTFYGNQAMELTTGKLSSTIFGADINSSQLNHSFVNAINSKMQLTSADVYTSKLRFENNGGVTYNAADPSTPSTADPIDGQGYTAPTAAELGTEQNPGMKVDCKDIFEKHDIDVTKPHADIATSKVRPTTFATYCTKVKDEENAEKQIWAEFQSIGGEGPFKFTYDIWKQKGHDITRIVKDATVQTSDKQYKTPDMVVPIYDYNKPIIENGDTIGYEKIGEKTIEGTLEYPDSVILRGTQLIDNKYIEEGATFTIIVKELTDHFGDIYSYDCYGEFNLQREFSQNVGAQIFFEGCEAPANDLDWDNDGILNIIECDDLDPANLKTLTDNTLNPTNGKWVRYREGVKTQKLFAKIVNDANYLNENPTAGRVLTLLPSVLGVEQGFTGERTFDISDKFGYEANSGKVVVSIANCLVDKDRFMTAPQTDRLTTYWTVGGTLKPYVLMQATPASTFHADNYFAINVTTNPDTESQTELYTDLNDDHYTVFENEGTKKVLFNNEDANLTDKVALSHLNAEPNTKYFEFTQSADKSGMVNTLVTIMVPCDDDMDGIPNFFDTDSDGDGCFDALEGGDDVTEEEIDEEGQIKGEVDADGVPVLVNPGGEADVDGKQGQEAKWAYDKTLSACANYWTGNNRDGDFNNPGNWTKERVPQEGDDIIFANGQPDANGQEAVFDMLMPAGYYKYGKLENEAPNQKYYTKRDKIKKPGHPAVVIPADGGITVTSVKGFETEGDKDKIVMKASGDGKTVGTFVLKNEDPCASTVFATVEFRPLGKYLKGNKGKDDKDATSPDYGKTIWAEFDWQFMGLPVKEALKSPVFKGVKVRAYDEKLNSPDHYYQKWVDVMPDDKMTAFKGYEVAPVEEGSDGVHQIQGQLNLCEQTIGLTRQAAIVTASKATDDNAKRYALGHNVVGNSFMAGVNIKDIKLESGEPGVEMDNTVYLYSTGSWEDWKTEDAQPTTTTGVAGKGGYEAVPINLAGQNGMTGIIAPMQGFMVKYENPVFSTTEGKLTIPYTGLEMNGGELRAKGLVRETENQDGSIFVRMDNGRVYDKFYVFQRHNTTMAYDNGYDGEKLNMGEPSAFGMTTDGRKVQVMTVPNVIGAAFSVQVSKDVNYDMKLTAEGLEYQNLKLVDMKKETVTPFVDNKVNYFFEGDVDGIEQNRFMFVNTPETDFGKVLDSVTGIEGMTITLTKGKAELFNLSGAKMGTFSLPLDAQKLKGHVPAGVYLIKATDGTNVKTSKIVIE